MKYGLLVMVALVACVEEVEPPRNYYYGDGRIGGDSIAGGDSVAGDPGGSGDHVAGDPGSGDHVAGDPGSGDHVAGDPASGDHVAGDPGNGDPGAGDPFVWGDPGVSQCTFGGDPGVAEVIGTPIEDLAMQWPAPLELCNLWQENASLAEEIDRKIRVLLPPQVRPGLASFETMQVGIEGALIERSPMLASRWRFTDCVAPAEVTQHELTETPTYTQFRHALAYDFGAAGRIIEELYVYRSTGDARPIIYDGDPWGQDAGFYWESSDQSNWAVLSNCAGGSNMIDEVTVISAFNGADSITVLRDWRTAMMAAGSFPVHLLAHQVVFSDRPWQVYEATGFWTHAYSAQHHNWFENTLLDFSLDPRAYHYLFRPNAPGLVMGGDALSRIDLRGLASWSGTPSIDTTFVTLQTGAETTTVYDPGIEWNGVNWRYVGDGSLLMGLQWTCSDGEILTFGTAGEGYWLRFLTCPRATAPGFDLDALVPVVFTHDAHHAGVRFTDTAITEVTVGSSAGFQVDLGNASVRIWEISPSLLGVDVRDGTSTELYTNTWTSRQDARDAPVSVPAPSDEEINSVSASGDVSMRMVRRFGGFGGGLTYIYAPIVFELTFDGTTHLADAFDGLEYTYTHHNDSDTLVATDGILRMFWSQGWDASYGYVDRVHAETVGGGVEVLAETMLIRP